MDNIKLYKKITLEIIQCLKDDKIEELEILFEKREKILQEEKNNKNNICSIDYSLLNHSDISGHMVVCCKCETNRRVVSSSICISKEYYAGKFF